ncbi:MAG TPA: protein kinase [Candidatus Sulfotelmatobacter sp.]|nr:protein kinase [Candidatus Sulfotelmatobacter sp.]
MGISAGTRLGPYEILAPLGAGGMGEVYRARDTRLERTVAIKVLPSHLSDNPDLKQRFEREAKAISQLNHPNICTLYDVGHEGPTDYLVMEFLEGESLAERLKRGTLPLKEIIGIGCNIADALDRAHRAGIVHRDLKPGNIMLTKSGAKLLDFGLAKAAVMGASTGSGPAPLLSAAMTMTSPSPEYLPLTRQGALVGTVQYMSPEQIQGNEADARSDIFAFGAVLYEMATGKRPFEGKSQIKVASAILEDEPQPVSAVLKTSPAALDRLVSTCLAKSPEERFQSALDVKLELRWLSTAQPDTAPARPKLAGWIAYVAIIALATIAVTVAILLWSRSTQPPPPAMQFTAALPFSARSMAVAPNGHTVALAAYREDIHKVGLFLYDIGATDAKPLAGTNGATFPFWSPDGRALGFFASGKLKRFDLDSASVRTLCDAPNGRGGAWSKTGVILFTPTGTLNGGIMMVSDNGGNASNFSYPGTTKDENTYRWPVFLPDGKHYLFLAGNIRGDTELNKLYLGSIDNPSEKHFLTKTTANGDYANGYVFFVRDGAIQAQKLDLDSYSLTGDVKRVIDNVKLQSRVLYATFAAGGDIVVAQEAGEVSLSRLTWYDHSGKIISDSVPPDAYGNLAISPDGKYVAIDKTDESNDNTDAFIYDLARSTFRRLTFDPGIDAVPVWSPNGGQVAFTSSRGRSFDIYVKPADGSQPEHLLVPTSGVDSLPLDWSRDGHNLLYLVPPDLWVYSFADRKSRLFLKANASLNNAQFSPDGKWVAYSSNESGRWEVYVTSFPDARGKWQVSSNGGEQPRWRGDGKEIYFLSADAKLMAASVDTKTEFESGTPAVLFQTDPRERVATTEVIIYDVARDGQRFIVNTNYNNGSAHPMSLVLNWKSEMKK